MADDEFWNGNEMYKASDSDKREFCRKMGDEQAQIQLWKERYLLQYRRVPTAEMEKKDREIEFIENNLRRLNFFITVNPDPAKLSNAKDIIEFEESVLFSYLRCKWVSFIGPVFREQAPETGRYHYHMVLRTSRYKSPAEVQRYWWLKKESKGYYGDKKSIWVEKVSNFDLQMHVDRYCRKDGDLVDLPKDLKRKVVEDLTEHFYEFDGEKEKKQEKRNR